jgi:YtoQ family protein
MTWQVYLSGEIHTDWRERIEEGATAADLDVRFTAPVTDHAASDAAGTAILGEQERPFWNDHIGAGINAIRTPDVREMKPAEVEAQRRLVRASLLARPV